MRKHSASFANFICRFGEKKVLLDYAEEIVIPAFTRDTYIRSFGQTTHYHFYDVSLVNVSDDEEVPVLALAGQFIKDTELTRHQIFDNKRGLVKDERHMRSAPSVFFLLILNNHRLVYFPETPHAPSLKSFAATAQNFLKRRHKEYIEELYRQQKEADEKVTKKALYLTHPVPSLEVIALTSSEGVSEFVRRYKTLKQIEFRLVLPNDDIDAGEILGQIREFGKELNSTQTKLRTSNSDGLDIDASVEAVQGATATGNQEVKLSGLDEDGNALSGNNEEFQVSAPLDEIPAARSGLINRLYAIYNSLAQADALRAPPVDRTVERIRQLLRLL